MKTGLLKIDQCSIPILFYATGTYKFDEKIDGDDLNKNKKLR